MAHICNPIAKEKCTIDTILRCPHLNMLSINPNTKQITFSFDTYGDVLDIFFILNSNSVKSKNNPSDLNSLISNGVYACGDIASIKNLPSSMTTSGILIVFSNKPYIGQIIFSHVFFYTRFSTSFGNEWYDWVKIK